MERKLYTADLHFGHKSVLKFDKRPFESIEEHDKTLIDSWNSRVDKNTQVYILGDIALHNEKAYSWYLKQLNGHKHLIVGNHDRKLLKDSEAMGYFVSVDNYLELSDNGRHLVLCHYPMAEWNGFFSGALHLYGHIHNSVNESAKYMLQFENALNCGCMINNYAPVSLEELIRNNKVWRDTCEQ